MPPRTGGERWPQTRTQEWPGQRLGLPQHGSGSVAGWGRRIFALAVDWVLCLLVVSAFAGRDVWTGRGSEQWAPLVVFFIEASLLTALVGGSAGQLATRIGVRRLSGGLVSPPQALLRTFLICLVIPPVIYNRDQRGLHDMAVGSITVRR